MIVDAGFLAAHCPAAVGSSTEGYAHRGHRRPVGGRPEGCADPGAQAISQPRQVIGGGDGPAFGAVSPA